ncbi:ornithine carbamoyltransferase [candidate division WOR_3 bacterium SM1_77]|uniref:Ornithine carbamoyltransferase n=1 Tax=candidate division WOR_3 bacterium SM1_77 TaxID=1703778 RepID=A0A0S8JZ97_UNCW3|nr:MAG: ornithine carbamoyltransferase [candidate division WOR_3 bacterium SM1_77]
MKRYFISIYDLKKNEIMEIFELTKKLKESQKKGIEHKVLKDKTLAMVFEKPSLRTRVTFETGMTQLGGHAIYLAPADIQLGKRESIPDVARNLSRWVDFIMARVFTHKTVEDIAKNATIPVINALSDVEHPCQIMADLFTVAEHKGSIDNITLAYIGDGNNVCNSFVAASSILGFRLHIATPAGYEPDEHYIKRSSNVMLTHDPKEAVVAADIVYTDVWASMGQEQETAERKQIFAPYQINRKLLAHAKKDYLVMHCLPAHRGEEITDEVIDGPNSVVLDEAENRLHVQKGILVWLSQRN